jgi:hypothetical protein
MPSPFVAIENWPEGRFSPWFRAGAPSPKTGGKPRLTHLLNLLRGPSMSSFLKTSLVFAPVCTGGTCALKTTKTKKTI